MFTVDKSEIGHHIADLINESRFKSARQFGIAYLKLRYGSVDEDAIPNIQNRISQITQGNKWIQIEDLPIFAELLGVSIEDIVSAGASSPASSSRVTNYSIAHSDDPSEWSSYIQREDNLVLNPDEYNKTVIDYALEAGNYTFLKYLMENEYIWFIGDDKDEYHDGCGEYGAGFGAGTKIKRRDIGCTDTLNTWLKDKDDLRFKMMSLAIKNRDFSMLDCLRAREIPMLYTISHFPWFNQRGDNLPISKNVERFLENLASCPNTTLSYFFEPFPVKSVIRDEENTFIFPYAGPLLDYMVEQGSKNTTRFIEKATGRNKDVFHTLQSAIDECIKTCKDYYEPLARPEFYNESLIKTEALQYFYFYPNTGFVTFTSARLSKDDVMKGFITNIVHMTAKSSDPEIQFLIDELNESYESIRNISKEKDANHA